jgi:DivIVA domain-containing protein
MDRPSIQRSDFPTTRRGYEPDAVDAHLRAIADEVESLRGRSGQPVAAEASSRVQSILEAAEATAEQLRAEAGEEAREHVHRVSTAARELLERLGAMHDELGGLMDRLREDAGRLSAELRSLERDVAEIAPPAGDEEPLDDPEPVAEDEGPAAAADRPDDVEAARLVALDMALAGTPRDETEKYLAEHYSLADPAAVLDDVYALAGS